MERKNILTLQANSAAACQRACEIEGEFLCRSYLYLGPPNGAQYNCRLYHLDHWTLPDGPSTFLLNDRPLIDNGGRIGTFYENRCKSKCEDRKIFFLLIQNHSDLYTL